MIIRTSGLFGPKGARAKGGNFIETMIRLGTEREEVRVVTDQTLSPTFTPDLAAKIYEVVCRGHHGLYHITGSGHCSWYEFAQRIFELMELPAFGAKAKRPGFSVLHNGTLSQLGIPPVRHWDEALREYLRIRNDKPSAN
jgi:dTDP-4-dehydrorhamnose reductase